MTSYVLILGGFCLIVVVGIGGYYLGRYQNSLVDKIRTLEGQAKESKPEPAKPTVVAGAYQPPKEVSTSSDNKPGAGLVETKTPERLDWENANELTRLEHSN